MGRKLEFCRNKALNTAMESFWAQGYEATSMRELAARLGLHLGSVYNALGDKEKVFEAALKLNIEQHVMPHLKALSEDADPMGALENHLNRVARECADPQGSPGCFIVNSLLEIANINESISATLRDYLQQVEDAYTACLDRAKGKEQFPQDRDPRQYARFIMASIFSMRAMAKLKAPKECIENVRDCAYRAIAA